MNRIMKSLISTAAVGFLAAGSIAIAPASAQQPFRGQQQNQEQDRDRDWDRDRDRDWNYDCNNQRDRSDNRNDDRCDSRRNWRDDRGNVRWNENQHNGYYSNNGWRFGPPGQSDYNNRNYAPGYHPWKAGDRLGYYNNRYTEVNYRFQNLKRPNRGDHWVRDDRGVYILASISSGRIRQVQNRTAR